MSGPRDDPALLAAIDALVLTLEDLRRAYDAWARAPQEDAARLRGLLDEAERRVDAARAALEALEARLGRP